jgi:hypothetical protein
MYLRLTPNLMPFVPDLGALYALRHAPNFYEIHLRSETTVALRSQFGLIVHHLAFFSKMKTSKILLRESFKDTIISLKNKGQ